MREGGSGSVPAKGSHDLFCHVSAVSQVGWDGTTVTCEIAHGWQGPQVGRVHAVDVPAASPVPAAGRCTGLVGLTCGVR